MIHTVVREREIEREAKFIISISREREREGGKVYHLRCSIIADW